MTVRLDMRDEDGDRLLLYDFNEDTPLSARATTKGEEALLRVHQYTAQEGGGVDAEDGMSVLVSRSHGEMMCKWLIAFFDLDLPKRARE